MLTLETEIRLACLGRWKPGMIPLIRTERIRITMIATMAIILPLKRI
jgi:hypothetical protein